VTTLNLLRLLGWRHAGYMVGSALLHGLFQYLICAAVASADVGGALQALMSSLPPILRSLVSSQLFGGLTPQGLMAFGWNHPIAHALGTAVAIILGSRAIAGESETGAMELLLSQPISRPRYLAACVGFALGALALVSVGGIVGTVAGQRGFGLEGFEVPALAKLGANFFLLQCSWFGITLMLSAFGREGGRVASGSFLIALLSYLAQVIGRLWERAAFVLPYTLHDYFSPQAILVQGEGIARPAVVLAAVVVGTVGIACWRFQQRDLP
jgi:ABC-2 type transport system permease protein